MVHVQLDNNLETYITAIHLIGTASTATGPLASFDYVFEPGFRTEAGQNPGPYSGE